MELRKKEMNVNEFFFPVSVFFSPTHISAYLLSLSFAFSFSVLLSRPLWVVILLNLSLFRDPSIIPVGFKTSPPSDINLFPWHFETLSWHTQTHTNTHIHDRSSFSVSALNVGISERNQWGEPNGIIWLCSWRWKKSRVSPLGVGSERQMTDSTCKRSLNLSDVIVSDSSVDA